MPREPGETNMPTAISERTQNASQEILVAGSPAFNTSEAWLVPEFDTYRIIERHYRAGDRELTVLGTWRTRTPNLMTAYIGQLIAASSARPDVTVLVAGLHGHEDIPAGPLEALATPSGEAAMTAAWGELHRLEVIKAELDPHHRAAEIIRSHPGISRDELALHYTLRAIGASLAPGKPTPLPRAAPEIYRAAGIAGSRQDGGWVNHVLGLVPRQFSQLEIQGINAEMPNVVAAINAAFAEITAQSRLLELTPAGDLVLLSDLMTEPIPWDPAPELLGLEPNILTHISRYDQLLCDRHYFDLISKTLDRERNVIFVTPLSHVSALTPAWERAFSRISEQGGEIPSDQLFDEATAEEARKLSGIIFGRQALLAGEREQNVQISHYYREFDPAAVEGQGKESK